MKRKKLIVLAAGLAGALIVCGIWHGVLFAQRYAETYDLPPVAFNFPLSKDETRFSDSSHIYEYNIATQEVTPHFIEGLEWLDADMAEGLVLGRTGDAIVELDLTDDSVRVLGPNRYQGQPLEFVRRRPGTEDYCGITERGELVLWDQAAQDFVLLKRMTWNGYSFGCSWSGDGKRLYIPDETGIGVIDVDTLDETHWLTLSVYYPQINEHSVYKTAFAVSTDQRTVVYCSEGQKLMMAQVSGDGRVIHEIELGEFDADCAFSISDNNEVVFVLRHFRAYFFSHGYYEIGAYRDGTFYKLKETDWANNIFSGTYVFW